MATKPSPYRLPIQLMPGVDIKPQVAPVVDMRFIQIMRQLQAAQTALEAIPGAFSVTGVKTHLFPGDPSSAYSGIDNTHAALVYAQLSDLNALRGIVSSLLGVLAQLVSDVGAV
jgi:hypothetical protein